MKKFNFIFQNVFLLTVIAAFCGGSVCVMAKVALEVFQPFTVISLRFLFAVLFLLPFIYRKHELSIKNFKSLFWVGILGALNPILLFIALPFTKASVAGLIYACIPALTALYIYFVQKKSITRRQIVGVLIGFLGVVLIILLPVLQKNTDLSALAGNVLIFGATIALMFYGFVSKKSQQEIGASPLALTFYFSLVALVVSLPFTGYELFTNGLSATITWKHLLSGVYIGVIGTGIFYLAYQYALKLGSELVAALYTYLQPISSILLAAMLLGEQITGLFIIGGILAVIGARYAGSKR